MLSNKVLRIARAAAPTVGLALVALIVAFAVWRMWFRKERYSQFQARQWKWNSDGTGAYKCPSGWKDTGLDSPPPTTKDGTWQGGDKSARHCRQAKNTAFSGTIWDDDKGESVCPTGFEATGKSGERACKKKDYEGVDAGCNKDYPIRGQRTGYEGRCCRDKFSRVCEGKTSMEASGESNCPWDYPYKGTRDFNMGKCCKGGSSTKCQGAAPTGPVSAISRKYPYWGWAGTKNEGLRCKYSNNTGCDTKWEGSLMKDAKTTSNPAPSSAKKKDGESCSGGNQCQSGLCSKEKRCYSIGCPKTGATVWHAKTRKCLWPCGSGKERNDKGECAANVAKTTPTPAATTDIMRVYPHWGWAKTKTEGLRCKFGHNTGCTTKWVGGKLVEA